MEDKKKVLFSFVGMRDPYSYSSDDKNKTIRIWNGKVTVDKDQETRSEGSVLTACRWLKPDIVYLFPSSKEKAAATATPENHTEDGANEARKVLTQEFGVGECHVMPLMTDNSTDYTSIYTCLRNNMRTVFKKLSENYPNEQDAINRRYELIFILTSGTQQMNQTAQLYLSTLPYEFKYYKCIDPKHAQGQDRVQPMQLKLADETLLLKSIEADIDSYHFHSVIDNCERLSHVSILKARKGRAAIIKDCFSAYEHLDLMHYEEAYKSILAPAGYCIKRKEQILEEQPTLPLERIHDVLNKQVHFLEKLKTKLEASDEDEDENNLIDLYYNMKRAYTRGNYVDVLARFWRLREGMMNYRMLKYYHLDRRNLNRKFSDNDERERVANYNALKESTYKSEVDWINGRVKNEIGAIASLLKNFFQDSGLNNFECRFWEELETVKRIRNQTIVAHGMLPVSQKDADVCISLGKEIIKLIPDGKQVCEDYPFKLKDLREVLNLLKYI